MIIYAVIITFRGKVHKEIATLREQYNKYVNYTIVPHITLLYPVVLKNDLTAVYAKLEEVAHQTKPFVLELNGVQYFEERNNVAYIAVEKRQPVVDLHYAINHALSRTIKDNSNQTYTYENFTPHITVAELIPADIFPYIKMELSKLVLRYRVRIDSFSLFSARQNKTWETWKQERVFKLLG
ncbi:MAG TPA: 2'-5' RNA ligase family protein [Dehalococcoidales bacterium]